MILGKLDTSFPVSHVGGISMIIFYVDKPGASSKYSIHRHTEIKGKVAFI